jgi:hypothetical protein
MLVGALDSNLEMHRYKILDIIGRGSSHLDRNTSWKCAAPLPSSSS